MSQTITVPPTHEERDAAQVASQIASDANRLAHEAAAISGKARRQSDPPSNFILGAYYAGQAAISYANSATHAATSVAEGLDSAAQNDKWALFWQNCSQEEGANAQRVEQERARAAAARESAAINLEICQLHAGKVAEAHAVVLFLMSQVDPPFAED